MDRIVEGGRYRRLSSGLQLLDSWAENASLIEKNAVYQALFAVSNGSVFRRYSVVSGPERAHDFFVLVRDNLIIKIRMKGFDAFGIEYIGPPGED